MTTKTATYGQLLQKMIEHPSVYHSISELKSGTHMTLFYDNDEFYWKSQGEYFRKGVDLHEQLCFIYHAHTMEDSQEQLRKQGLDIDALVASGQLVFLHTSSAHMKEPVFDGDKFARSLPEMVENSVAQGYSGWRGNGEMGWIKDSQIDIDTIAHYEASLTSYSFEKATILCSYDICTTHPSVLVHSLETHPVICYRNSVMRNFYYVEPHVFLRPKQRDVDCGVAQHWLNHVVHEHQLENDLLKAKAELEAKVKSRTQKLVDEIAQHHETVEELEVLKANLEKEVERRTTQLRAEVEENQRQKEELKIAKETAETAMRAKTSFFSQVSHEIRTPLYPIITLARLMLEREGGDVLSEANRESIEMIYMSGKHLLNLIDNVLEVAKIDAQKVKLDMEATDIHMITNEVWSMMKPKTDEKGIQFVLRNTSSGFKKASPIVTGDSMRLRQILLNLVGNAIRFTDEGTVTLECHIEPAEGVDSVTVNFGVEDTGIGIPEDAHDRVFEPLEQANETISRDYGGTGLGLTISQNLVRLMGGELDLKSRVGEGTRFFFTLRPKIAHVHSFPETFPLDTSLSDSSSTTSSISRDQHDTIRILLAEDNVVNQLVSQQLFKRLGYSNVTIAVDGLDAVAKVQQQKFDVIFMDLQMPRMNGIEAVKEINEMFVERPTERPVIGALTASVVNEQRQRCSKLGMEFYLLKPLSLDTLSKTMESLHLDHGEKPE